MNSGGGHLLLAEMVLPDGDAPHAGKMLDIVMLIATGGEERTASQYRSARPGGLPNDASRTDSIAREHRGSRALLMTAAFTEGSAFATASRVRSWPA